MSVLSYSLVSTANRNPLNSPNPLQLPPILRPKFHCSPTYSVVTWAIFWNSPGISTHEVLYTGIWGFSRRTIVRSRLFGACPCWFIAKFGELQHQRLYSTDAHQKDSNVLLFVLKRPIFGYITLHGLIYQESVQKKTILIVVLCDFRTSACSSVEN